MKGLITAGMVLIALQGMIVNHFLECRKKRVKVPPRDMVTLASLFVIFIGVLLVRKYSGELGEIAVVINALCTVAMILAAIWLVGLRVVVAARCVGDGSEPASTFWINAVVAVVVTAFVAWLLYGPVVELINLF